MGFTAYATMARAVTITTGLNGGQINSVVSRGTPGSIITTKRVLFTLCTLT